MSDDGQQLAVALQLHTERWQRNFDKANQIVDRRFKAMETRAKQAGERMERSLRNSTANINNLLRTLGVGVGFNELRRMAEVWTDISSRVNIAAGDQEKGAAVMERVAQIARRTYSDLGQTAEAYIANSQALKDLGYSTQTQLDYTEALNNALVVSGAKGQRAESVMNALAKAMAFGELRGENLNTVISTGGRVAQALADGLGVTVNELRNLGQQGKLTSDVVVKALTGELAKLREEADSMPATITDAFVLLRNAMTQYVGQLNEANGITSIFSDGIIAVADNFDSIAAAAAAAGAILLGRYVPGLVRATAAQAAMVATNPFLLLATAIAGATYALHAFGGEIHPVAGELATLHDYAGAAWDTIRDGATAAAGVINDVLVSAINYIANAITGAEVSFASLGDFVKRVVNQIAGEFVFLYGIVTDVLGKIPAAVAEATIAAMNGMIGYIEKSLNGVIRMVNAVIESINGLGSAVGVSLGTIGQVTLGRIENAYAGAGEAAGEAYGQALKRAAQDHVGEALGAWRELANERAAARQDAADARAEIDSIDRPVAPTRPSGGSGRGGGGSGGNDFDRQVQQIQQRIAAMRAETEARRGLTGSIEEQETALEAARIRHELLTAAQNAGLAITPALQAQIDQLANSYANASLEAQQLADSQQHAQQIAQDWANLAGSVVSGFINDLRQGKSASEAFANALNKIIDKLVDMFVQMLIVKPLMSMFGFSGGGLVGGGGGGLFGFADGGFTGRGGKYEPAGVVHRGEYVMSKKAVERIGVDNLERMHRGALRGFADGGFVSNAPAVRRALPAANQNTRSAAPAVQAFNITNNVKVEGSAGTPEQNADLAKRMSKELEVTMRSVVADEVRKSMRPGNPLNRRGR